MQRMFSQFGAAYPPGMLSDSEDLHPLDILMRDGEIRRQWNAERLAYQDSVLAETEAGLAERSRGHHIRLGNPDAVPAAEAPRPSVTGLADPDIEAMCAALLQGLLLGLDVNSHEPVFGPHIHVHEHLGGPRHKHIHRHMADSDHNHRHVGEEES
jgi:hypothetical protein